MADTTNTNNEQPGIVDTYIQGFTKPFTGDSNADYSLRQLRGTFAAGITLGAIGGYFGTKKYLTGTF